MLPLHYGLTVNEACPQEGRPDQTTSPLGRFAGRVLVALALTTLTAGLVSAALFAADILFVVFAAVLLAILVRTASGVVQRRTGLGAGWALGAVWLVIAGLAAAGVFLVGSAAGSQFDQLAADLPKSVDQLRARVRQYSWGDELLARLPGFDQAIGDGSQVTSRTARFFSSTFGVAGNLLVLTAMTVYLTASPRTYRDGLVRLVPPRYRRRADEVIVTVIGQLSRWLVGRVAAVAAVGAITGVGLWVAGVPQPLVLALVAAVLSAVPYLGPLLGAIPGVLMGLLAGPTTALWAVGVYLLAQVVENYLITPLVQQRAAHMPPALTVAAVAVAGALFGVYGLAVAAPLTVAALALVRSLYLEDVLGEPRRPVDGRAAPPPASEEA
jgi:predicted PurR-regulated permease PerM